MKLLIYFSLVPRLGMSGAVLLMLPYALVLCTVYFYIFLLFYKFGLA